MVEKASMVASSAAGAANSTLTAMPASGTVCHTRCTRVPCWAAVPERAWGPDGRVSLTFLAGSGLSGDGSEAAEVLLPGDEGTAEAAMFLKGSTSWLEVSTLVEAELLMDLLAEVGSFRLASRTKVSAIAAACRCCGADM